MNASLRSALAALALASLPAAAQTEDQPLVIAPLDRDTQDARDEDRPPIGAPLDRDAQGTADAAAPATAELEIETLDAVDIAAVGTLDVRSGGLGSDMWQGSQAAVLARLLPRLAGDSGSRAATQLARRLLLTAALPPQDELDETGAPRDLLAMRIDRLVALGLYDQVPALVEIAGARALSPFAHRRRVDALLLAGAPDAACQAVAAALREGDDDALAPALIFCQRFAGQHAAADLGLAVLRDAGLAVDPRFLALDRTLAGGDIGPPQPLASLEEVPALLFAMAALAGALPSEALADAPAPLLKAAAGWGALPLAIRLAAAERAVAAGVMDGRALGDLYRRVKAGGGDGDGPAGRALLFQAALLERQAQAKAKALAALLHHGAAAGGAGFLAAAAAAADEIASLVATPEAASELPPELSWFAGDALLALLAAGQSEAARPWWPLQQRRQAGEATATLWPLCRLAWGDAPGDDGEAMRRWWASGQRSPRQTALYLALLAAFDDGAGAPLITDLLALPDAFETDAFDMAAPAADVAVLLALELAARAGRRGETVLLALLALGDGGPGRAPPATLRAVATALAATGLEREARAIATEAAFAAGP